MATDDLRPPTLVRWPYDSARRSDGDNAGLPIGVSDTQLSDKKGGEFDTPELAFIEPAHDGKKAQAVLVKNVGGNRELYAVELSVEAMTKMLEQLSIEIRHAVSSK